MIKIDKILEHKVVDNTCTDCGEFCCNCELCDCCMRVPRTAKQKLLAAILAEKREYDLVTNDFGTALVISKEEAVPISAIEKMFGEGE